MEAPACFRVDGPIAERRQDHGKTVAFAPNQTDQLGIGRKGARAPALQGGIGKPLQRVDAQGQASSRILEAPIAERVQIGVTQVACRCEGDGVALRAGQPGAACPQAPQESAELSPAWIEQGRYEDRLGTEAHAQFGQGLAVRLGQCGKLIGDRRARQAAEIFRPPKGGKRSTRPPKKNRRQPSKRGPISAQSPPEESPFAALAVLKAGKSAG